MREVFLFLGNSPPPAAVLADVEVQYYLQPLPPMSRSQNWCLTINNPESPFDIYFTLTDDLRYVVWQLEEVSTQHIQAYAQFTKRKSLKQIKKLWPTAHAEIARGSYDQNKTYCTKNERAAGPYEIGVPLTKGQRTDLEEIREEILDGATEREIADAHFPSWTRNYKAFERYRYMIQEKKDWPIKVIVLTGPTNIGKSRYVFEHAPNAFRQCNKQWFTHYCGEQDVIFDEFYGSRFPFSYLLQLLDRYPMTVETKGGEVNFIPKRIWITSNKNPWEWYDSSFNPAPLVRRISYHREILEGEEFPTDEINLALSLL